MTRPFLTAALVLPLLAAPTALPTLAPLAGTAGMPRLSALLSQAGTADATNIKRSKVKKRGPSVFFPPRTTVLSQDAGDGDSTSSVESTVTYLDDAGNEVQLPTETMTSPKVEKVYFDWTPPAGFAGGTVLLGCSDCSGAFAGVPLVLGGDPDWDGDNEDLGDTALDIRAWKRSDGTYRFRLKGKPAVVGPMGFTGDGLVPAASLVVDGEDTEYKFTREVWRADLDADPADLDGVTYINEVVVRDAAGEVLDSSLTTDSEGDAVREGIVIDRLKLTETGSGDTKLRADVLSDDITDTPTLSFEANDNATGTALVSLTDAAPTHSERQFGTLFDLVETGNFVDMTYIAEISLLDDGGAVTGTINTSAVVGEGFDAPTLVGAEGDVEFALTLTYLENYEEDDSGAGPVDAGYLRVTVAGLGLSDIAGITVRLTPDDGGTDLDDQGPDGDAETVELPFVGAWHVWTATGSAGNGDLDSGGSASFSATAAATGDATAPLGLTDQNGGYTEDFGIVYGFGSGTKKSTTRASSRAELQ